MMERHKEFAIALDEDDNRLSFLISQKDEMWRGEVRAPIFNCPSRVFVGRSLDEAVRLMVSRALLLAGAYCYGQINQMIDSSRRGLQIREREFYALLSGYLIKTATLCRELANWALQNQHTEFAPSVSGWIDRAINIAHDVLPSSVESESKRDTLLEWISQIESENAWIDNIELAELFQTKSYRPDLGVKTGNVVLSLSYQGTYQECFLAAVIAQDGQEYVGNAWDRSAVYPLPVRGALSFVVEQVIYRACWVSATSFASSLESVMSGYVGEAHRLLVTACYLIITSRICRQILLFCTREGVSVSFGALSAIAQVDRWVIEALETGLFDNQAKCAQLYEEVRRWIDQIKEYMVWTEKTEKPQKLA